MPGLPACSSGKLPSSHSHYSFSTETLPTSYRLSADKSGCLGKDTHTMHFSIYSSMDHGHYGLWAEPTWAWLYRCHPWCRLYAVNLCKKLCKNSSGFFPQVLGKSAQSLCLSTGLPSVTWLDCYTKYKQSAGNSKEKKHLMNTTTRKVLLCMHVPCSKTSHFYFAFLTSQNLFHP